MLLDDWRDADSSLVADLYEQEWRRWHRELGWNTRASWEVVEEGRTRGLVPGWILRDADGTVRGWTSYVLYAGELQIGGLCAGRAVDFRRLLDRVLDSPEASLASSVSCFVFPAPASLISALARRRFAVRRSLYLSHTLEAQAPALSLNYGAMRVRPYADRDMLGAVRLLSAAYEGEPGSVCFAPHGRLEEWVRYLRQLIDTPACGVFLPAASLVAEEAESGRLVGLVLATSLSADTGHVAQLVVGRDARRQGIGELLIARACAEAQRAGFSAMTLMVDEGNAPAMALYARRGFRTVSAFAFGRRGQVRQPALAVEPHRLAG